MKRLLWPAAVVVALGLGVALDRLVGSPPSVYWPLSVDWSSTSKWLTSQSSPLMGFAALATGAAAIIGGLGLPFAIIAAFGVRNQVKLQRKIAYEQSSRECLWRYSDAWRTQMTHLLDANGKNQYGRATIALRHGTWKVAAGGFTGKPDDDVIGVLNFFDNLAYMRWRGDLDQDLAYNSFSSDAERFHESSIEFVEAYRQGQINRTGAIKPNEVDLGFWVHFDWWVTKDLKEANTKAAKDSKDVEATARRP